MTDSDYPRTALAAQLGAALDTLGYCIEKCPDVEWQERHGDYPFSQVVFHTLFYCDFYLSSGMDEFKSQLYHASRPQFFKDYEELADRLPVNLYGRDELIEYLGFCMNKAYSVLADSNDSQLEAPTAHKKGTMSMLELAIYITRHIQHHAAQLGLRLQQLDGTELPWFSRGTPSAPR